MSLATPSKNSCVPSSTVPAVVPRAMRPKRFLMVPVNNLSNWPVINLPVMALPKADTEPCN